MPMRASRSLIALFLGVTSTCFAQAPTWTQKCSALSSQAGYYAQMAYDSAHGQMVLFGGVPDPNNPLYPNDTWIWDGTAWTKQSPATSPPGRAGFGMAYDSARGKVVIFGGSGASGFFNDTWEWDGTNWTQKANGPGFLLHIGMAYDAARQQVVIYGGSVGTPSPLANTWVWDGNVWTQKFPATNPGPRSNFRIAYDAARQQIVMFGGWNGSIEVNETWIWDGTNWTQKFPTSPPSPRQDFGIAYDANRQRIAVFSGIVPPSNPVDNNTYEWDGTNWTQDSPTQNPTGSGRGGVSMEYDAARSQVVLFGGANSTQIFADTWVFGAPTSNTCSCVNAGGDTDGDGLCDDWEKYGLTVNVNGVPVFVDLPAMGADPNHKDIFVQADYMIDPGLCLPLVGCFFGHTHKPKSDAIANVIQAFAKAPVMNPDGTTGIHLHVDCGSDCVMNPVTGEFWSTQSQAHSLAHLNDLGASSGGIYDWTAFQAKKTANFSPARGPVFHYVVWAHNLGGLDGTSGISRGTAGIAANDFIVSLGSSLSGNVGTTLQQAGTFMHELGHNLSLRHGGADDLKYKPNYLSVMNYLFQTNGLIVNGASGTLDYSRFLLPSLNENDLNENIGLNGGSSLTNYGTSFYCADALFFSTIVLDANGPIDWNCNGNDSETNVSAEINSFPLQNDGKLEDLNSFNDWPHLAYNGGAIGQSGLAPSQPTQTVPQPELTLEMDAHIAKLLDVSVSAPGSLQITPGASTVLVFTITNQGVLSDTYALKVVSTVGWGDLSGIPSSLKLSPGASSQFQISINLPASLSTGTVGSFSIKATSQTSPAVNDSAETDLTVAAPVGDFSISATPASQTIPIAKSATFTLTLTPLGGFIGNVPLTCGGGPSTSTCTISSSSLKLNGSSSATAAVTIKFAKNSDTKGTFNFALTGTFGSWGHGTAVSVTVKE